MRCLYIKKTGGPSQEAQDPKKTVGLGQGKPGRPAVIRALHAIACLEWRTNGTTADSAEQTRHKRTQAHSPCATLTQLRNRDEFKTAVKRLWLVPGVLRLFPLPLSSPPTVKTSRDPSVSSRGVPCLALKGSCSAHDLLEARRTR